MLFVNRCLPLENIFCRLGFYAILKAMNKIINAIETLGTVCGIIGAFLVAMKYGQYGYPFFFVSSLSLLTSAWYNRQRNFIALQGVFFGANILGLVNYL